MKYHNIKTIRNGVLYDSKKESVRASELELMQKAHLIKELERQKRFELQPKFIDNLGKTQRKIEYICDFYYYDNEKNTYVAEDVKSIATRQDKTYRLKKKMFMYQYPNIQFKEII